MLAFLSPCRILIWELESLINTDRGFNRRHTGQEWWFLNLDWLFLVNFPEFWKFRSVFLNFVNFALTSCYHRQFLNLLKFFHVFNCLSFFLLYLFILPGKKNLKFGSFVVQEFVRLLKLVELGYFFRQILLCLFQLLSD